MLVWACNTIRTHIFITLCASSCIQAFYVGWNRSSLCIPYWGWSGSYCIHNWVFSCKVERSTDDSTLRLAWVHLSKQCSWLWIQEALAYSSQVRATLASVYHYRHHQSINKYHQIFSYTITYHFHILWLIFWYCQHHLVATRLEDRFVQHAMVQHLMCHHRAQATSCVLLLRTDVCGVDTVCCWLLECIILYVFVVNVCIVICVLLCVLWCMHRYVCIAVKAYILLCAVMGDMLWHSAKD